MVRSLIPARLDRLPWTRFHTRLIMALGTAWILDGLEITLASAVAGVLTQSDTLHMSLGLVGRGDRVPGRGGGRGAGVRRLSDKLAAQAVRGDPGGLPDPRAGATAATAGAAPGWVALGRHPIIAGTWIGGEYTAINSAIDETIPARYRGRVDIAVNGTYWAGSSWAPRSSSVPERGPPGAGLAARVFGWSGTRCGYHLRPPALPESPRWLLTHGQAAEAEQTITRIEAQVRHDLAGAAAGR